MPKPLRQCAAVFEVVLIVPIPAVATAILGFGVVTECKDCMYLFGTQDCCGLCAVAC